MRRPDVYKQALNGTGARVAGSDRGPVALPRLRQLRRTAGGWAADAPVAHSVAVRVAPQTSARDKQDKGERRSYGYLQLHGDCPELGGFGARPSTMAHSAVGRGLIWTRFGSPQGGLFTHLRPAGRSAGVGWWRVAGSCGAMAVRCLSSSSRLARACSQTSEVHREEPKHARQRGLSLGFVLLTNKRLRSA